MLACLEKEAIVLDARDIEGIRNRADCRARGDGDGMRRADGAAASARAVGEPGGAVEPRGLRFPRDSGDV